MKIIRRNCVVINLVIILTLNIHICSCNPLSDVENSDKTSQVKNFTQGLQGDDLKNRWDPDPSITDQFKCPGTGSLTEIVLTMKKVLEQSPNEMLCISSKEYACTMLALINYNPEALNTISNLKATLKNTQEKVKSLSRVTTFHSNKLNDLEDKVDEKLNKTSQELSELHKKTEDSIQDQLTTSTINEDNTEDQIRTIFSNIHKKPDNNSINSLNSVLKSFKNKNKHLHQSFTELKVIVQDINLRASATEAEVAERIDEIYSKINQISRDFYTIGRENRTDLQNCTTKQSQNSRTLDNSLNVMNIKYEMEMASKRPLKIGDLFKQITQIRSDITLQLEDKFKSTEENQINLRNIIDNQFKQIHTLESNIRAQLEREKIRAVNAEAEIMEIFRNNTLNKENSQISLENEINRAIFAESNLHKLFAEQSEKFIIFEEDLRNKLNQEIQRAASSEKNISSIIQTEITRAKSMESNITQGFNLNISKIHSRMIKELNRAQSVEEGLYHKISDEMSRAINAEAHLRANINDETRRASEREDDLEDGIISEVERFSEIQKEIRSDFQHQFKRAVSQERDLDNKFNNYEQKLLDVNERLKSAIEDKAKSFHKIQTNLRTMLDEEIIRAKETEEGMLSTVMAGVTRAVEFENSLRGMISNETERSLKSEKIMRQNLEQDLTKLHSKLESVTKLLESESHRMEGWTSVLTRNATHHVLVMAQGLNQKYKKIHEYAYKRLNKVEEDLKICCNSGWFGRNLEEEVDSAGMLKKAFGIFRGRENRGENLDFQMEVPDFVYNNREITTDLEDSLLFELSKLDEAGFNYVSSKNITRFNHLVSRKDNA